MRRGNNMESCMTIYESGSGDFFIVDSSVSKSSTDFLQILSTDERTGMQREISTDIVDLFVTFTKTILTEIIKTDNIRPEKEAIVEDGKRELWETLMGDAPMPETSPNAVDEFSNALKSIVTTKGEENPLIDRLRELRGK